MPEGIDDWPTGRLLATAARLVEHAWLDALAREDLTHAGLVVLHLLGDGPLSQTALAEGARVEVQTMSRTIERLERAGHVERQRDAADARRMLVTRTEAGATVLDRVGELERETMPDGVDDPALRDQLIRIVSSLSEQRWDRG
jgi:MarR family transcriptional regulator, organic hydroperoxide resistance regulator